MVVPLSHAGAQRATVTQKVWLLCPSFEDSCPEFLLEDTQAAHIIRDNYSVVRCKIGSHDYSQLHHIWPGLSNYSFVVADNTGTYSHLEFSDEKSCLEFLLAPQKFGAYDPSLALYEYLLEGILLSHNAAESVSKEDSEQASSENIQKEKCVLSIRLMEGGSAKAHFNTTDCLMDVKRWLQQELKLLLVPEDDVSNSRYTNIGHFEPSRYAFFYPATRKTFSEAQEFLKLKDLGLCPRLALILRPDYDENAMKAAREAENKPFNKLIASTTNVLQALYSFFDYGVDDAGRDLQHIPEQVEAANLHPPHFLGSKGPIAPSASLINVHTGDTLVSQGVDELSHGTSSQANGNSVVNVGREEL